MVLCVCVRERVRVYVYIYSNVNEACNYMFKGSMIFRERNNIHDCIHSTAAFKRHSSHEFICIY